MPRCPDAAMPRWLDAAMPLASCPLLNPPSVAPRPPRPLRAHDRCRRRSKGRAPTALASHRKAPIPPPSPPFPLSRPSEGGRPRPPACMWPPFAGTVTLFTPQRGVGMWPLVERCRPGHRATSGPPARHTPAPAGAGEHDRTRKKPARRSFLCPSRAGTKCQRRVDGLPSPASGARPLPAPRSHPLRTGPTPATLGRIQTRPHHARTSWPKTQTD